MWKHRSHESAKVQGHNLASKARYGNGWCAEVEELVNKWQKDAQQSPDCPCAECECW
jgi:hypothetical protein